MEEQRQSEGASSVGATLSARTRALVRVPFATGRRLLDADDLLQHGSILAASAVASGGLNYAFQVYMGRALGPEQYGVFGALFALFYLVSVTGRGLRLSASRFAAELTERGAPVWAFHRGFFLRSLLASAVLGGLLLVASPAIGSFLDISSPWPVIGVAATVPFGLAFTANQGALQGLQWFAPLGGYRILQAGVKLLAGVVLVAVGYGVLGAIGALVVAMAAGLVASTVHLRFRLPTNRTLGAGVDYARVYRYVPPAVLAGFCLTVPANVDVILVKHFFSAAQAGHYNAAAVLGKVLLFLPMGISTALFPKVTADNEAANSQRMDALFDRALLYSAAVAGAGAAAYWLAPELIIGVFFGEAYAAAAPLLQWYGLAIFGFVLAVVVLNFELARDRTRFVYLFAAVSVAEIGAIWLLHDSMIEVIQILLVVNAALLAVGIFEVKR